MEEEFKKFPRILAWAIYGVEKDGKDLFRDVESKSTGYPAELSRWQSSVWVWNSASPFGQWIVIWGILQFRIGMWIQLTFILWAKHRLSVAHGLRTRDESQTTWVLDLAPTFTSCVTEGIFLNLSVNYFVIHKMRITHNTA